MKPTPDRKFARRIHRLGFGLVAALGIACGAATTSSGGQAVDASSGSGGEGGSSSDATPASVDSGSAPPDADGCVDCFDLYDLHWGMDGGLVPYVDTSRLGPCRSYTRERSNGRAMLPPTMCTTEVPACPVRTIADINRLIGDPGVAMSLKNHVLYGGDPRPVDGQVFRFAVGDDYVDVGPPCGAGASACTAIPAAVGQLVDILQELDRVELAAEPCKSAFGN